MERRPVAQLVEILNIRQNLVGVRGVMLHHREFLVGQAAGLFKYLVSDCDLSDIMERSGKIHFLRGLFIEAHKPRQPFRAGGDSDRVRTGERRLVIHYFCEEIRQRLYLREAEFLFFARNFAPQPRFEVIAAQRQEMLLRESMQEGVGAFVVKYFPTNA